MDADDFKKLIEPDESETLEVFIRQKMEKLGASTPDFESGSAHFVARLWARPNPNLASPNDQ
jgi:hypothetical protein